MLKQVTKSKEKRRAFNALINALNDEDLAIRSSAAKVLGLIGDERAVNSLINILKERDPGFCPYVAEAITRPFVTH